MLLLLVLPVATTSYVVFQYVGVEPIARIINTINQSQSTLPYVKVTSGSDLVSHDDLICTIL